MTDDDLVPFPRNGSAPPDLGKRVLYRADWTLADQMFAGALRVGDYSSTCTSMLDSTLLRIRSARI